MGFLSNKIWVRIFLGHPVLPAQKTENEWQNLNKKDWRSISWTCFILMTVKCLCRIMLLAIKSKKVKNYLQQKQIKML